MDLTKFGFTTSKKKKTDDHDDEKKEKKKQYETKRERNFQENWADEFPGVRHAAGMGQITLQCNALHYNYFHKTSIILQLQLRVFWKVMHYITITLPK